MKHKIVTCVLALVVLMLTPVELLAETVTGAQPALSIQLGTSEDGNLASALRVILLLAALSLLPAAIVCVTSFTRIVIVLGFVKQALGTQNLPPSQVIIGLSLFLTLFTMSPVLSQIQSNAWAPYQEGVMNDAEFAEAAVQPLREFMAKHTRPQELRLMLSLTRSEQPERFQDVSTLTLIPAFMLSELRAAFIMGAMIFIPFVIIDLVVASVLMAMGMMMVPPVMVSLPIKLILFVLADGWNLVVTSLVTGIVGA